MTRDANDQPRYSAQLQALAEHERTRGDWQYEENKRLGLYEDPEKEIKRLEEQSGGSIEALLIAQAERAAARSKAARQPRKGETAQTVTDRTEGLRTA